jgi:hypothetical protein
LTLRFATLCVTRSSRYGEPASNPPQLTSKSRERWPHLPSALSATGRRRRRRFHPYAAKRPRDNLTLTRRSDFVRTTPPSICSPAPRDRTRVLPRGRWRFRRHVLPLTSCRGRSATRGSRHRPCRIRRLTPQHTYRARTRPASWRPGSSRSSRPNTPLDRCCSRADSWGGRGRRERQCSDGDGRSAPHVLIRSHRAILALKRPG